MAMIVQNLIGDGWKELYTGLKVPNTKSAEVQCQGDMPIYVWAGPLATLPADTQTGLRIEPGETKVFNPGYDTEIYLTSTNSVVVIHF